MDAINPPHPPIFFSKISPSLDDISSDHYAHDDFLMPFLFYTHTRTHKKKKGERGRLGCTTCVRGVRRYSGRDCMVAARAEEKGGIWLTSLDAPAFPRSCIVLHWLLHCTVHVLVRDVKCLSVNINNFFKIKIACLGSFNKFSSWKLSFLLP